MLCFCLKIKFSQSWNASACRKDVFVDRRQVILHHIASYGVIWRQAAVSLIDQRSKLKKYKRTRKSREKTSVFSAAKFPTSIPLIFRRNFEESEWKKDRYFILIFMRKSRCTVKNCNQCGFYRNSFRKGSANTSNERYLSFRCRLKRLERHRWSGERRDSCQWQAYHDRFDLAGLFTRSGMLNVENECCLDVFRLSSFGLYNWFYIFVCFHLEGWGWRWVWRWVYRRTTTTRFDLISTYSLIMVASRSLFDLLGSSH